MRRAAPNQIAEMKDRHQRFMARVVELSNVLSQDAAAVVRATRDGSFLDTDKDYKHLAERARRDYGRGTFLIDRLGAAGLLDPTLAAVLLDLRSRLLATYGASAAAGMLIDQAVVAYQNFLRVTGWTGNTALMVEAEFFGREQHQRPVPGPLLSPNPPLSRLLVKNLILHQFDESKELEVETVVFPSIYETAHNLQVS